MLRSRRLAFVAATLVLGLSACGEAATSTPPGATPAVIHVGASKTGETAAGGAPVSDGMARIRNMRFVYDGALPKLPGTAPAWSLPAGTVPSDADILKIAAALGVKGDVRHLPANQGGGWIVGPADYTTPTLTVSNDGMLSWSYSGTNSAVTGISCGEAMGGGATTGSGGASTPPDSAVEPTPVDTPVSAPCAPPTPPAHVPDKATAEAKAKGLLTAMGYDISLYSFDTTADQWSANVTGYRLVGGQRSGLGVDIGFGGEGVVQWASGTLAAPRPATQYPIVGVSAGVERLNDPTGRWLFLFGGPGVARGMADDTSAGGSASGGAGAVAPMPPNSAVSAPVPPDSAAPVSEPTGTVPPVDVHLTKVELGLGTVWAQDGTVWLLPAYVFTAADGGQYTVIAVDEAYLDTTIVAPATTVPPITKPGTEPGTAVPPVSVPPATVVVGTDVPGTDSTVVHPGVIGTNPAGTGTPVTDLPPAVSLDDAKQLAGLTLDQATVLAKQHGWTVRVSVRDGVNLPVTADYSPTRVNVSTTTKNGVETVVDIVDIG